MKNILTVTIPSYRQPEMLDRSLLGLQNQTFKDFNVVIIDDNSGVNLELIVNKYKNSFPISVIKNEVNLGAMPNMFKSITLETESEYIFSYHEDDCIKSNYLEMAVGILNKEKNISFVLSSAIWVRKDDPYNPSPVISSSYEIIDYYTFVVKTLTYEPFIFGSVIYRKKDIKPNFEFNTYHTLCDKIFLITLLIKNKSVCSYITEPCIYVRDHSLDKTDNRSKGAKVEHLIEYFNFLKNILKEKNSTLSIESLITNGLLLSYSNLKEKNSILELVKKQKKYKLLQFSKINSVGIYSLISICVGKKTSYKITKLLPLKKLVKKNNI